MPTSSSSTDIPEFNLEEAPLLSNLSIEASAGTGKTYTLEQIVCRLVEHYGISIRQILLITYTDKAASELRERIRRKLSLRLRELENLPEKTAHRAETQRAHILRALNQYSEADISTIHGFFRSSLQQFALETGQSLCADAEIDLSSNPLGELLLNDLQNNDFGPEAEQDLKWAGPMLAEPKGNSRSAHRKLQKFQIDKLLELCQTKELEPFWQRHPGFRLVPGAAELQQLEQLSRQFDTEQGPAYQAFCQLAQSKWPDACFGRRANGKPPKNLPPNYDEATAQDFFKQLRRLHAAGHCRFAELLQLLLCQPPHPKYPEDTERLLAPYLELLLMLQPDMVQQNNPQYPQKYGSLAETWQGYSATLKVQQFLATLTPCLGDSPPHKPEQFCQHRTQALRAMFATRFLLRLRERIAPQLELSRLLYGTRSFSDMVEGLYRVLVLRHYGDRQTLLRLLRAQYRCALVDEFQDTDPVQWQILYQIFGSGTVLSENHPRYIAQGLNHIQSIQRNRNFIIVGDPKQSIYRFRGASTQLYQLVQQHCDHRFRLRQNYRSNSSVIGACNRIFSQLWQGFFEPVDAARKAGAAEQSIPFLREYTLPPQNTGDETRTRGALCFLDCSPPPIAPSPEPPDQDKNPKNKTKGELQDATITAIVQQVSKLLHCDYRLSHSAAPAPATDIPLTERRVEPDDIAVLMDRNRDCRLVQQKLQATGIAARFSQDNNVFCDPFAKALHYFLLAMCQPRQLDHSLRLLLSPLFELDIVQARELLGLPPLVRSVPEQTEQSMDAQSSEFGLRWIQRLFQWQEQVDEGHLPNVLEELFRYGTLFYEQLSQSRRGKVPEGLRQDAYSRILARSQSSPVQDNRQSCSNLRQLAGLLTEEQLQRSLDSRELCSFLARQIQNAGEQNPELLPDEYREQDCNEGRAVTVMTVYKAKGLEFPIVLTVLGLHDNRPGRITLLGRMEWAPQTEDRVSEQLCYRQTAFLVPDPETRKQEEEEEYAELQRLFYVALTRASSKIYLPFHPDCAKAKPYRALLTQSLGLGSGSAEPAEPDRLREAVQALAAQLPQYFSVERLAGQGHRELKLALRASGQQSSGSELPRKTLCTLPDAALAFRFPVVNSFSSLQQNREHSAVRIPAAGHSEISIEDSLGQYQDRERDELAALPPSFVPFVAAAHSTAVAQGAEPPGTMELRDSGAPRDAGDSKSSEMEELYWHELLLSPGVQLGKLLHDLLEILDYQLLSRSTIPDLLHSEQFYQQLSLQSRHYFPRSWIQKAYPALCRILWHTLHSDLHAIHNNNPAGTPPLQLCRLSDQQRRHELEFLLSIPQHSLLNGELFHLEAGAKIQISRGFLKGFIDLLFLHNGKLYLLDWKSNLTAESAQQLQQLNSDAAQNEREHAEQLEYFQAQSYHTEALEHLMVSHQYQMQYLIYLAVVYYYFKLQYGTAFCYSKHFGGCYYLFLRGMGPAGGGIFYHKPEESLLVRILQGLGLSRSSGTSTPHQAALPCEQ